MFGSNFVYFLFNNFIRMLSLHELKITWKCFRVLGQRKTIFLKSDNSRSLTPSVSGSMPYHHDCQIKIFVVFSKLTLIYSCVWEKLSDRLNCPASVTISMKRYHFSKPWIGLTQNWQLHLFARMTRQVENKDKVKISLPIKSLSIMQKLWKTNYAGYENSQKKATSINHCDIDKHVGKTNYRQLHPGIDENQFLFFNTPFTVEYRPKPRTQSKPITLARHSATTKTW